MSRFYFAAVLLLCGVGLQAQSNPAPFRCKSQKHVVDLSLNDSGRSVEGPACAQIVVNVLRYDVDFGKTVSSTPGQNLAGIFPSSFGAGEGFLGKTRVWSNSSMSIPSLRKTCKRT